MYPEFSIVTGDRTHVSPDLPPPWDMSACPYPYLDRHIGPASDGTLFLETIRGCPFSCRYCYYHKSFEGLREHPRASVQAVLDMAYGAESPVREIYLMDPTFNARKGYKELLRSFRKLRASRDIALHTELRADLLTRDDVRLLKDAGLKSAEVGLQSTNEVALRYAGRTGKPDGVARGVAYLKEADIDVTTGIIVGLPKDSPQSFSNTLAWLKKTAAYSTVHPFVLSVLPGTDFRSAAKLIGLRHDSRPPYYVTETPDFPHDALGPALRECEDVFDMEMDYIPPVSLVDRGARIHERPSDAPYVSKWIVCPERNDTPPHIVEQIALKATDPFTIWFKGASIRRAESAIVRLAREFSLINPHGVLCVVLEFEELPSPDLLERLIREASDPSLFLNRAYAPLLGDGAVVSPYITLLLKAPEDSGDREALLDTYASFASIVWDYVKRPERGFGLEHAPLLISRTSDLSDDEKELLFSELGEILADREEEALFRDATIQRQWDLRYRKGDVRLLSEEILSAGGSG